MTQVFDMRQTTPDEREQILGREFRELRVLGFKPSPPMHTIVILDGVRTTLVGDPQQALRTYLGGKQEGEALQ